MLVAITDGYSWWALLFREKIAILRRSFRVQSVSGAEPECRGPVCVRFPVRSAPFPARKRSVKIFVYFFFLVSSSRRICGRGLAHFDWAVVVSPFFFRSFLSPFRFRRAVIVCVFVCTWMGCRGRYQKATAGGCRPEKAGDDDRDGLWSIITQEEEEKFETPKRGPSGENRQLRNVK